MSADPFETRLPEAFSRVLIRRRMDRNMTHEALAKRACHRPAYWSQAVIGMWEPVDDRRNGAKA
jgi:hypothetical protein